jgi:hypothetical protein
MDIAMRAAISSFEMWSGMLLLRLGVAQLLSVGEKLGSFRAAISINTSISISLQLATFDLSTLLPICLVLFHVQCKPK